MDIKDVNTQLELVQECHHRVLSAQNFWNAYRRAAGEHGIETPPLPQFVALLTELTHTAEELTRRIDERKRRFDAVPILQAMLRFKDGSTRRIAVMKPTDAIDEPYIGEMFYDALMKQGVVASLEDYPVFVVDKRKRVVNKIPVVGRVSEGKIESTTNERN